MDNVNRSAALERDIAREREGLNNGKAVFRQALDHYAVSIA
jgi:hypothetical protein